MEWQTYYYVLTDALIKTEKKLLLNVYWEGRHDEYSREIWHTMLIERLDYYTKSRKILSNDFIAISYGRPSSGLDTSEINVDCIVVHIADIIIE